MVVHICCSVDAHYFLERLRSDYPDERIIGYFYNPNIHPENEYRLRYIDTLRSCKILNIELIDGSYEANDWFESVRGFENEPEKGKRCVLCFDIRFEKTAALTKEMNEERFTTTLLMSPLKDKDQINARCNAIAHRHNLTFVPVEYRTGRGADEMAQTVKENRLYKQNYCGCQFGLKQQRFAQNRFADELCSPLSNAVLPGSIEERLELYTRRNMLESKGREYLISKTKFLNYRQLNFKVTCEGETTPAYALPYSMLNRQFCKTKAETAVNGIYHFNRENIKALTLDLYNTLQGSTYGSIAELIYDPPSFETENRMRLMINGTPYDISPILVFETVPIKGIKVTLISKLYEDHRENLTIIN